MALIDRVREVNRCLPNRQYYRLYVNDCAVGFVDTQILADLAAEIFMLNHDEQRIDIRFEPHERAAFEAKINDFFKMFFEKKNLNGWRNEYYAVAERYQSDTLFLLERAALSFLGLTGYGVHINGYVEKADGLYMWVAKRSLTKPTSPGKLDQIAAGGQPYDLTAWENVIKECEEEANIPEVLAKQAKPVSAISYWYDLPVGMRPDVIFNYDLRLPENFTPTVNDDEVHSFELFAMPDLLTRLAETQDFKFNSAVVIIDFAMRHGLISPEHPEYLALQEGMHQRWRRML